MERRRRNRVSRPRGSRRNGLAPRRHAAVLVPAYGSKLVRRLAFGATYAVFWCVNKVKSMRVAPEVEEEGLDVPEFGMPGYPEDAVVTPY